MSSRAVVIYSIKLILETGKREGRREENSDNNRTERRGPLPEDKCFNCDKTGHWYVNEYVMNIL